MVKHVLAFKVGSSSPLAHTVCFQDELKSKRLWSDRWWRQIEAGSRQPGGLIGRIYRKKILGLWWVWNRKMSKKSIYLLMSVPLDVRSSPPIISSDVSAFWGTGASNPTDRKLQHISVMEPDWLQLSSRMKPRLCFSVWLQNIYLDRGKEVITRGGRVEKKRK